MAISISTLRQIHSSGPRPVAHGERACRSWALKELRGRKELPVQRDRPDYKATPEPLVRPGQQVPQVLLDHKEKPGLMERMEPTGPTVLMDEPS